MLLTFTEFWLCFFLRPPPAVRGMSSVPRMLSFWRVVESCTEDRQKNRFFEEERFSAIQCSFQQRFPPPPRGDVSRALFCLVPNDLCSCFYLWVLRAQGRVPVLQQRMTRRSFSGFPEYLSQYSGFWHTKMLSFWRVVKSCTEIGRKICYKSLRTVKTASILSTT